MCPVAAPAGDGPAGVGEHVVAVSGESGSVSKMAIVRSRLARQLGRYLFGQPIAAGGMATVHLGPVPVAVNR